MDVRVSSAPAVSRSGDGLDRRDEVWFAPYAWRTLPRRERSFSCKLQIDIAKQSTLRRSWLSFYKTTHYNFSGQQYIKFFFMPRDLWLPLAQILCWGFCFSCECSVPTEVEDLTTEAIQWTNSLIGPCPACPSGVDGSESVRPSPSVVQGIACRKLPEDNRGCASENLGLSSKHVRELAECSCQSTSRSGELSGALTLGITSLRVNVRQWWNHDPSNAPTTRSAGTMTGLGFTPDCAITGSKKEINIKSECCALVFSFSKRRQLRFL